MEADAHNGQLLLLALLSTVGLIWLSVVVVIVVVVIVAVVVSCCARIAFRSLILCTVILRRRLIVELQLKDVEVSMTVLLQTLKSTEVMG